MFEFRGAARATLRHGTLWRRDDRPFDFKKYLADAAEKKQTLTRLFTLFREMQSPQNPYSTRKPESPDYIAPFRRTGPGRSPRSSSLRAPIGIQCFEPETVIDLQCTQTEILRLDLFRSLLG